MNHRTNMIAQIINYNRSWLKIDALAYLSNKFSNFFLYPDTQKGNAKVN